MTYSLFFILTVQFLLPNEGGKSFVSMFISNNPNIKIKMQAFLQSKVYSKLNSNFHHKS